jgi:hypothetical protein
VGYRSRPGGYDAEQMSERTPTGIWATALLSATSASYLANCALGVTALRRKGGAGNARWLHHAFFVSTSVLAAASAGSLLASRSRAVWLLLPAGVPLALIPRLSAQTGGHVVIALSIAPFMAASVWKAWR